MSKKIVDGFLVSLLILTSSSLCFGGMQSENYRIARSVQSGGGVFMASESFVVDATLGQASPVGLSSSAAYDLQAGFWFYVLLKGDLNGDGEVNLADLVLSLQLMAGMSTSDVRWRADVNRDGRIGLAEAVYILGKTAGLRD
jgi:hypothetical protein